MILERFFEYYTRKLNVLLELQQAIYVRYLPRITKKFSKQSVKTITN